MVVIVVMYIVKQASSSKYVWQTYYYLVPIFGVLEYSTTPHKKWKQKIVHQNHYNSNKKCAGIASRTILTVATRYVATNNTINCYIFNRCTNHCQLYLEFVSLKITLLNYHCPLSLSSILPMSLRSKLPLSLSSK